MSAIATSAATGEYEDFCATVLQTTGLELALYRRSQMERRTISFARQAGLAGLGEYGELIRRDAAARACFMQQLTINVSQLWRNPAHWIALEHFVVPELMASHRVLRAWCAGVSYGAEAYTLAAICRAVSATGAVEILGTDIDPEMIERASEGVFTEEDARDAPRQGLQRGFVRVGGAWRARPELMDITRFEVADLLRSDPAPETYDLIVCRNTVIYFEDRVRDEVHRKMAAALRPGGRLVVGGAERVVNPAGSDLEIERPFIYRKA